MSKLLHVLLIAMFAAGIAACSKEEAPAEVPAAEAPAAEAPAAEAAPAPAEAASGPGGYEPTPEERVPGITEEPAATGS